MSLEILEQYQQPPEAYDPLASHPDPRQLVLDSLTQGTLLAGREKPFVWEVDAITSEASLHRYRALVEVEALINFAEYGPVAIVVSEEQKETLRSFYEPSIFDAEAVASLDHFGDPDNPDPRKRKPLEHDVKAVEVYLGKLLDTNELEHLRPWLHFGMTSEDTNNLAFNLMVRDLTNEVLSPAVARVADRFAHLAVTHAETPVLGITHAQKASPTTVGKQFGYLLRTITTVTEEISDLRLTGKFAGAVGNHNPETALFSDFDYDAYCQDFVESLGFSYNDVQNQRNDHLAITSYLSGVSRLAVVGKNAAMNSWLKILEDKMLQQLVEGEAGSSTMTQKINPWRLEDAEALFEQAIGLISKATEGLVESRHERDLSDHAWERAYGDMVGRVIAGFNLFAVQLDRLVPNEDNAESMNQSAEVLGELIQTAGRAANDPDAYAKAVELTQGKRLTLEETHEVIHQVLPDGDIRDRVLATTPDTYTGIADELARRAVVTWHAAKVILERGILDESTSIDAVLFDLDGTLHHGDKDELFARLSAIAVNLRSGFSEEEIREFGNRSEYSEMKALMVRAHNDRFPENRVTEDQFQEANDAVSGTFDSLFYTAEDALKTIQVLKDSGKATGLVTTRGNKSRDRLLNLHGFEGAFDVVVGRNDAEQRKPHPQPIVLALEKLGITDARRSLYVGDLQFDDIGAGNAIHMKTALVNDQPLDHYGPKPTYHWKNLQPLARLYGR